MSLGPQAFFTDPKIVKYLGEDRSTSLKDWSCQEIINLGIYHIKVAVAGMNELALHFENKDGLIGSFFYAIVRNPGSSDGNVYYKTAYFFRPFGERDTFFNRQESIEYLLRFSEFKEWMIWNSL